MFLWEAWQNPTLIILIVAAVTSLALGIKTQGIEEGWYDGGSIAFAVILVIVVKDNLFSSKVKMKRSEISIYSVGINAEWGTLMASISADTVEETPLQGRLNGVATLISKVEEYTVAVFVLIVLLVRYFTGNSKDANENVLFIAATTKVGPAIDGAIQIVNVAVCIYFLVDG